MEQTDSNYAPPQSAAANTPRRAGPLLISIAMIMTVLGVMLGYAQGVIAGIGEGGRIGELIGQSIGVIILALLVVAIFQLFKRFRNQRSRWKIYSWTIFIVCLSNIIRYVQSVVPQ